LEDSLRLHPALWRSVLGRHPSFCYLEPFSIPAFVILSLFEWSIDRTSIVFVLLDKLQLI